MNDGTNPTNDAAVFLVVIECTTAYMLADRGYDVWMGNARGNTYSNKHIFLKESDEAFWKFT